MKYVAEIIKQWKKESGAEGVVQFKYNYTTNTLTIFTFYCGYLIGGAGRLVKKYEEILRNEVLHDLVGIEFKETDYYAI